MSRTGRRAIALLSLQGSLSVLRGREGRGLPLCPRASAVSPRGVLAEIPLFFWLVRPTIGIRGNKNFVVFPKIGADGYFDHARCNSSGLLDLGRHILHKRALSHTL